MVDLPGPKLRIGRLLEEPLLLVEGDKIVLTVKELADAPNQIPVSYKRLPESVTAGDLIFLNGGFIQLQVREVSGEDIFCRTVIGGSLLSHKGLSIPGVKIMAAAVSQTDLAFVDFALQEGVDTFGISFVEAADDLLKVKEFTQKKGCSAYVVAKIERAEAIDNIDEILAAADAVMLSEETAIGRYPVAAAEMISKIAISTERERKAARAQTDLPAYFQAAAHSGDATVDDVVTLHAVEAANALNVRYLLTCTKSRAAPCLLSRFRPDCWILSHGGDERTKNFLSLSYGVFPVDLDDAENDVDGKTSDSLVTAGMVTKDEKMIWVEDETSANGLRALSMNVMMPSSS